MGGTPPDAFASGGFAHPTHLDCFVASLLAMTHHALPREPLCRDRHQLRENHHQEQHDQLRDHEWADALDDVFHADPGDAANDVQHDTDRWRDEADGIVDDEHHAEIDRVDAGRLDDR